MTHQLNSSEKTIMFTSFLLAFFIGSQPIHAQNEKQKITQSVLWEVSGKGLSKPSYLFGTIHVYDTTILKIPQKVYFSIDNCDALAVEINFDNMSQSSFLKRMKMNPEDGTLDQFLSLKALEILSNIPAAKLIGMDEIVQYKPFMLSTFLILEDMATPVTSVDMDLFNYAKKGKKQIIGLETVDKQLDYIDEIPLKEQIAMLEESLLKLSTPKEELTKILTAYKEQNFKYFETEMEQDYPNALFSEKLLKERNVNMISLIDSFLKENKTKSIFVAVGAAHINDTDEMKGLVGLLKEKGYTLTPVEIKL